MRNALLFATALVLLAAPARADETATQTLTQGLLYTVDCGTTAVNTGLGAGEGNALPRAFHNNTSLVNCGLFYTPWVLATELLRHAPIWRRIEVGAADAQEIGALKNNLWVGKYMLAHGSKFWQYAPIGGFFRLRL